MPSKHIPCLIRFRNDSLKTISQIDSICHEYDCVRSEAIRLVFDYLEQVDQTENSPLSSLK